MPIVISKALSQRRNVSLAVIFIVRSVHAAQIDRFELVDDQQESNAADDGYGCGIKHRSVIPAGILDELWSVC